LAVLLVAAIAAGCGGDDSDEDPTAAWASGFCTAITDWTDELQSIASQFTDTSNLSEDGVKSAADDLRSATDQLKDDLQGLGRPETPSGEQVESSVDQLSTTLEDEAAKVEETAQGVSSLTELPSAITTISASITAMSSAFTNTFSTIEDADAGGELQAALEASPECDQLTSGSS
jgi:methyl-accepting chemotaxis protein